MLGCDKMSIDIKDLLRYLGINFMDYGSSHILLKTKNAILEVTKINKELEKYIKAKGV